MMFDQTKRQANRQHVLWFTFLVVTTTAVIGLWLASTKLSAAANAPIRRVNVPYRLVSPPNPQATQPAIFWFGRVDNVNNYADGRVIYDDTELRVFVHVMDRRLWYDTSPTAAELAEWDAVTLYLSLDGNHGLTAGTNAYQFVAQLNHWQARDSYQAVYRGNGAAWIPAAIPFTTTTGWRADGLNNNQAARGWHVSFTIPFSSLGLAGPPAQGSIWGLAVVLHDRDDAAGTPIPDTVWPETMVGNVPASWGQLHFGLPASGATPGLPTDTTIIRHGLAGATVYDAHVGGHTVCGSDHWPDYFSTWGEANYAGYGQINVQNQWDIADWPCFSKYFVTFPLAVSPPVGKTLLRATLVMHQFGSAWGDGVEPSYIQVLTVNEAWQEATITWNNAPLAGENLSGTWVEPVAFPGWPGIPHAWDVTRAFVDAMATGQPLRLALYSADGAYHSGRYFSASEAPDWNATARPTLYIVWGEPCGAAAVHCAYLPHIRR
jgi:hypothetical protein